MKEITVRATLEEKLDVDYPAGRIPGACTRFTRAIEGLPAA